jgi:hypothetical protein
MQLPRFSNAGNETFKGQHLALRAQASTAGYCDGPTWYTK